MLQYKDTTCFLNSLYHTKNSKGIHYIYKYYLDSGLLEICFSWVSHLQGRIKLMFPLARQKKKYQTVVKIRLSGALGTSEIKRQHHHV